MVFLLAALYPRGEERLTSRSANRSGRSLIAVDPHYQRVRRPSEARELEVFLSRGANAAPSWYSLVLLNWSRPPTKTSIWRFRDTSYMDTGIFNAVLCVIYSCTQYNQYKMFCVPQLSKDMYQCLF